MTLQPDPEPGVAVPPLPATGHHEIDRALNALELGDDVTTHPDALGAALDAVARAMAGPSIPQGLKPQR